MDRIESLHGVADDITPLKSLRAGDLQCKRTREALIQTLRDDIRLRTLLKQALDAEIEMALLDDRTNTSGT